MPQVRRPQPPDGRTLVDRFLDRLKNNRVAAAVILACLGLGGLASLTDSARKLGDLVGSFGSVDLAGEWKSGAAGFHPHGPEFMRLTLTDLPGGQVGGEIQFSGDEHLRPRSFPVLEGRRNGKSLTLVFDSGAGVRETVVGEIGGGDLRFTYQRPGRPPVPATAQRMPQAGQLVAGRLAIRYQGREFPDHRAACTQMLQELDPPQAYQRSEAPDEHGNVHCVGRAADGGAGFDMFQNEVQQQVVCPAGARTTLVGGRPPPVAQACECDGDLTAQGGACGPR